MGRETQKLGIALSLVTAALLAVDASAQTAEEVIARSIEARGGTEASQRGIDETYDHDAMAPVITASRLSGSVEIDGVPREAAWMAAEPFTDFRQNDPDNGEPVSERTEVRVLVGNDALYVAGWFYDSEPDGIRAQLVRRDVVSDFDYVIVSIDSRHDHNTSYAFTLTPSGSYQDAALGADGRYDFGWDPVWEGAASRDAQGWYGEWRIPFSQIRFDGAEDPAWGIQVTRVIARKREDAVFAFTPRGEVGGPHRYGHLVGLGRVQEARRLELLPYATMRSEHLDVSPGDPFRSGSEQSYDVGVDVKYGLTSNLTLNGTINPDFGQVEVDPAVLNLTQYETFYPERRPFFVEGAEIFRYGFPGFRGNQSDFGSLFYSRRIGRAPQRSLRALGAQYVDIPDQSTIAGAAKVSGRIGDWSVGILEAVTLEEQGRWSAGDGVIHDTPVEPFSNYVVGRARRDFRSGSSTLGGILTAVNRDLSDPALSATLHSSAYVGGVDFNHLWDDREWFVTGTLAGSTVNGSQQSILLTQRSPARYWHRPDADHVDVDPTRTAMNGWRGSLSAGRRGGDHWRGSVLLQAQSPGFEANDMGFETRVDSWDMTAAIQYRDMEPNEYTRYFIVDLSAGFEKSFAGDLIGSSFFLGSVQQWSNFWRTSTAFGVNLAADDDRLTRGGPVARRPRGLSISQMVSTDQRKPYNVTLGITHALNSEGGWGWMPNLTVTVRPSSAIEVSLEPAFERIHAVAQYVTTVADEAATRTYGARYVFSDLDRTMLSLDTRLSWTFTPRLSLQLYAQPFLASGDYSRFKEMHEPRVWNWDVYGSEVGTLAEGEGIYTVDPDGDGPAGSFQFRNPDFNIRSLRGSAVLRWEYLPGSTLYLVWQQRRLGYGSSGQFDLTGDAGALFDLPSENVFGLKVSYWWGG